MGIFAGHALRQYIAGGEFIVNRDMDVGVRVIKAGEILPWRDLGMHEVRVHQLWRANLVDSAPPKSSTSTKPTKQKPAAAR